MKEGRNRQIRRMMQPLGHDVVRLKRVRMASVRLGRLAEGAWRHLHREERDILLKML